MALTVHNREQIPDAPWYVLSTDTFMSGWGPASGRTNRLILPRDSKAEAEDVADYARSRTDTSRGCITTQKPRLRAGYLWQVMNPDHSHSWYRLRPLHAESPGATRRREAKAPATWRTP